MFKAAPLWQSLISGDVEELSTRLAACAVDEDVDDLMQLCERYKIGKGLKKQHESELARRLGVNVDEFHKELKKELIRKRKGDLMDHGMGKNPDLLLDKNGAPYLRDVSSGKTIPVEW
ncbi:hypothetical protein F8A87_07745 [Betaproteobacteria bacterium SCN2]|jgi:hypothetical protein|nr:hypothetical protein F8A87_07745 [Betaproteobacteria bacterium SCN2]